MMAPKFLAGAVEDLQPAAYRRQESQDGPQQRRFSGSVRSDDPDEFPILDLEGDVLQRGVIGVSERCVIEPDQRLSVIMILMVGMRMFHEGFLQACAVTIRARR